MGVSAGYLCRLLLVFVLHRVFPPGRLILGPRATPSWAYSTGWTSSISDGGPERRDRAIFGKMMSNITA